MSGVRGSRSWTSLDASLQSSPLTRSSRLTRGIRAVCFEFASGTAPDPARAADSARMGAALARLHLSMSQLPKTTLPPVSALRTVGADNVAAAGAHQLLHGDFNASNLRESDGAIRIFDLDDCGNGPPVFDIANALYMVLFDASTDGTMKTYETFRRSFLEGYAGTGGQSFPQKSLDRFIDLRVQALGAWLDDLANAPLGVRASSAAWQATLRSFVARYRPTTHRSSLSSEVGANVAWRRTRCWRHQQVELPTTTRSTYCLLRWLHVSQNLRCTRPPQLNVRRHRGGFGWPRGVHQRQWSSKGTCRSARRCHPDGQSDR